MLRGSGGMLPVIFLIKLVRSGRSKVCYYQPKINNFKDNKSTTSKLNCHTFLSDNLGVHVSTP